MELPPYHLPTVKSIVLRTWDRLKTFLFNAGKAIIAVVVVLSFLNSMGTDGSFGNENTDRSVLAAIGKSITPAVEPMGIHEDNWPATVGLFSGIFAKEAVVGTLNALYGALGSADEQLGTGDDKGFDPWDGIVGAFATIPTNLAALANAITDPLGLSIVDSPDIEAAARHQGVAVGIFGTMASRFDGRLGAFAYLLAVLLYMPCVAAMAAIYRETGTGWAVFASLWTTGLGYGAAVVTYQSGTFATHPGSSGVWIGAVVAAFIAVLAALYYVGTRAQSRLMAVPAE
jgi:ferrous iron transport protein B